MVQDTKLAAYINEVYRPGASVGDGGTADKLIMEFYEGEDINKNRYRILHNNCLTHIMHYKKINYIDNIEYYKNIGIRSFRLELLDETYDEVIKLINEIKK